MSKHTPSPWKCGKDDPFVYALNAHGSNRFFAPVNGGWTSGEAVEGRTEEPELLANARLISAAPDLLEALTDVLDRIGALSNPNELLGLMERHDADKVWAALKKARGEG